MKLPGWFAFLRPKKWIPSKCPICRMPLTALSPDLFQCVNGHRFGKDGKKVPLINSGEHRGPL